VTGAAPVPFAAITEEDVHSQHLLNFNLEPMTPGGLCPGFHFLTLSGLTSSLFYKIYQTGCYLATFVVKYSEVLAISQLSGKG